MLRKETRKKLNERKWLAIKEDGSNPSLSRKRLKDNARTAIRDLTLIAKMIPQNEFYDVFDEEIMKKFLVALFYSPERRHDKFMTNVELASIFVEIGTNICIEKYETDNYETPNAAKPVIDYLKNTINICNEIGHKTKHQRIQKDSDGKFVFTLKEVYKDDSRFDDYLTDEHSILGLFDKSIKNIGYGSLPKEIIITLYPKLTSEEDVDFQPIGIVTLNLNFADLTCNVTYSPLSGYEIVKELNIRKKGADYIFLKK